MVRVYLASPLGFSEAGLAFLHRELIPALEILGLQVHDPWAVFRGKSWPSVVAEAAKLTANDNSRIGQLNAEAIIGSDFLVAVLDGTDVDSGTAAEIGFAHAKKKRIFGYLGDVRVSKDNQAAVVNLQVEWFIRASGGTIATSLTELTQTLKDFLSREPRAAGPASPGMV